MDAESARYRLYIMTAADSHPVLSGPEVDMLVLMARRADADGRVITDADWEPTYDLNAAAAEGWRWKAAKAAGRYTISTDGQTLNRSDMKKHCDEMARMYASRVMGSVAVVPAYRPPLIEEA